MLLELRVRNYGLLENLNIEFTPGLNILTGETGAGKSILIGAMSLALGERALSESIRTGEESATVEALFELSTSKQIISKLKELDIEVDDNNLLLKRVITKEGRTKCYLNGSLVPLSTLKEIGDRLVDLHGQHDHQLLLQNSSHIDFLDGFGNISETKDKFTELFNQYNKLHSELLRLKKEQKDRIERKDLYEFQFKEINSMNLVPGEDEKLEQEQKIQNSAEKLLNTTGEIYYTIYQDDESFLSKIGKFKSRIENLKEIDPRLEDVAKSLNTVQVELEELSSFLRNYNDSIEYNPIQAEKIRERLYEISKLKNKYGPTIDDILLYRDKISKELESIEINDSKIEDIEKELKIKRKELSEIAIKLSQMRKKIAKDFEKRLVAELADLGMEKTEFKVAIQTIEDPDGIVEYEGKKYQTSQNGIDSVEFLISPNPGEELKPLSKIASGGEISRIMLALKTVLNDVDKVQTLVFDEIDTGIGGRIASAVGEKLETIARNRQVLCITHLPQIAASADTHIEVKKRIKEGRTFTEIKRLSEEEQITELARMMGGEKITNITRIHAEEMRLQAKGRKKKNAKSKIE